jgi:hypothetical protein
MKTWREDIVLMVRAGSVRPIPQEMSNHGFFASMAATPARPSLNATCIAMPDVSGQKGAELIWV